MTICLSTAGSGGRRTGTPAREGSDAGRGRRIAAVVAGLAMVAIPASSDASSAQSRPAGAVQACAVQLFDLQRCVDSAASESLRTNTSAPLKSTVEELRSKLPHDVGNALFFRSYWLAYAEYRLVQVALAMHLPDQARAPALDGERILDSLANKSAETYALQSLLVYEQFSSLPKTEMGMLIGKSLALRGKLVSADSLRALYARAVSDWNTPKEYGGGQAAERLLRQALAAPDEPAGQLRPTWGKDDCARLLVVVLKATGRADEARALQSAWTKRQPDSIAFAIAARL